jgi:hypothetical protein
MKLALRWPATVAQTGAVLWRTLEGWRPAEGWIPDSPALRSSAPDDRLDRIGSGTTASGHN